ncbi:hypothetical protein V9T40_005433 [Parthenolecanium corni]|uniref:Uncharacterized protein n=1 Tax=Parthenolecanium corni TaxID=536013 RepID=A0AAN9Y3B3_9HEMI
MHSRTAVYSIEDDDDDDDEEEEEEEDKNKGKKSKIKVSIPLDLETVNLRPNVIHSSDEELKVNGKIKTGDYGGGGIKAATEILQLNYGGPEDRKEEKSFSKFVETRFYVNVSGLPDKFSEAKPKES